MTSPEPPNPGMLARQADDGQSAIDAVQAAVADLEAVGEQPVTEHVQRFEAVHTALTDALSKADQLQSHTPNQRS